ncbi:hypothetical protein BGZ76_006487 [Entomortierella beljakovae]|nr:hypothetical protein BGZ76_006487 [Entomortierella beljakovae]
MSESPKRSISTPSSGNSPTNNIRTDTSLPPVSINTAGNQDGSPPKISLQEPSPLPKSQPGSPPSRPRGSTNRSYILSEIPSAMDLHVSPNDGIRSHSPSIKSISGGYSSDTASSVGRGSINETKQRFEKLPNGSHRHYLSAPKRYQYLTTQVQRLRDLLDGGKKDKDEKKDEHHLNPETFNHPLSLLKEKIKEYEVDHRRHQHSPSLDNKKKHTVKEDFVEKYGELQSVVGRGAFGTVRQSIRRDPITGSEVVFAIKEFKHNHDESQKSYMRRLTSEFCIASTLKHKNVIETLDLLQLHGDAYSEVMEYCPGGDLHTLIASADTLGPVEAGCFFAQLINGVAYLHSMGVVHRDLKPENLLLTADGCLKIADFGNSEVFRMPWEKKVRSSASIRGSGPFIAPEEFTTKSFDGRKVDMWSCGIIYMCMRLGRYNWAEASKDDPHWDSFLYKIEKWNQPQGTQPAEHSSDKTSDHSPHQHHPKFINLAAIEATTHTALDWPEHISEVIDHLMEPNPRNRWQVIRVLDSDWMRSVDICHPSERPKKQVLDESDFDISPSQRIGSKVLEKNSDVTGSKVVNEVKTRNAAASISKDNNGKIIL